MCLRVLCMFSPQDGRQQSTSVSRPVPDSSAVSGGFANPTNHERITRRISPASENLNDIDWTAVAERRCVEDLRSQLGHAARRSSRRCSSPEKTRVRASPAADGSRLPRTNRTAEHYVYGDGIGGETAGGRHRDVGHAVAVEVARDDGVGQQLASRRLRNRWSARQRCRRPD